MSQKLNTKICRSGWLLWLGMLLLSPSGCSQMVGDWGSFDWKTPKLMPSKETEELELPGRVLAIWTDAVHHRKGQPAERGFGGRIVFYKEGDGEPIQVDGTLTIYAFGDEDGNQSKRPETKFVFGPDQLKQHYSKCGLGDSYSVWLPWDQVGGPTRQISLITRFEGRNGGTVISEPARKLLPGVDPIVEPDEGEVAGDGNAISLASYVSGASPIITSNQQSLSNIQQQTQVRTVDLGKSQPGGLNTETYRVPSGLGMRPLSQGVASNGVAASRNGGGFGANSEGSLQPELKNEVAAETQRLLPQYPDPNGTRTFPAEDSIRRSTSQPSASSGNQNGQSLPEGYRREEQAGATVYYGPRNLSTQNLGTPTAAIGESAVEPMENNVGQQGMTYQNALMQSRDLRQRQLQQVKDSRQQFRSEPWRFPVRTQSTAQQFGVASDY